jgi:hypothetical protein
MGITLIQPRKQNNIKGIGQIGHDNKLAIASFLL